MLALQYICDLPDRLFPVDHAGRIVRRIDENNAGLVTDKLLKGFQIRVKSLLICRSLHHFTVIVVHIPVIFQEVWREDNHFFAWIQDSLQCYIQTAGCSYSHEDITVIKCCAESAIKRLCDGFTHVFESCIAHVSVEYRRVFFVQNINDGLLDFCRHRRIRIAQAEVIYIFRAIFCPHFIAFFEHCSDGRVVFHQRLHFICDHVVSSFLSSSSLLISFRSCQHP